MFIFSHGDSSFFPPLEISHRSLIYIVYDEGCLMALSDAVIGNFATIYVAVIIAYGLVSEKSQRWIRHRSFDYGGRSFVSGYARLGRFSKSC